MSAAPKVIGVVGAGTMGAGIAQLAAQSGARTLLHDPVEGAVDRGLESARGGIEKLAAKGRLKEDAGAVAARLEEAASIADLAPCELIVEAAPESLDAEARDLRRAVGGGSRRRARVEHLVDPDHRDRARRGGPLAGRRACTSSTPRR